MAPLSVEPSHPDRVPRPSIARRSSAASLADAVASAASAVAKLEAFLSKNDSQANLSTLRGYDSTASLQSDIDRVRRSEEAMRRELEDLRMITTNGSDGNGDSLGSWKMAGASASTSSLQYSASFLLDNDDVSDDGDDDERSVEIRSGEATPLKQNATAIRGQWSSALDLAGLDALEVKLEEEIEQSLLASSQSSDVSLDVEGVFRFVSSPCDEPSVLSMENDEEESMADSLCFSPSPVKTPTHTSAPHDLPELDGTGRQSSRSCSSSECSYSDSLASPANTDDISFTLSMERIFADLSSKANSSSPQSMPSLTTSVQQTREAEKEEEGNFDESSFENKEALCPRPGSNPHQASIGSRDVPTLAGTDCTTKMSTENVAVSKTRGLNRERAIVIILRWAERLSEILYGQ